MHPDLLCMQTLHHKIVDLDKQLAILEAELEAEDEKRRLYASLSANYELKNKDSFSKLVSFWVYHQLPVGWVVSKHNLIL